MVASYKSSSSSSTDGDGGTVSKVGLWMVNIARRLSSLFSPLPLRSQSLDLHYAKNDEFGRKITHSATLPGYGIGYAGG